MTCIAAAVNAAGEFVMGGDSAASTSDTILTAVVPKVFQSGEFVFGIAGSFRWQQLLRMLELPRCPKNADLDRYMAVDFTQRMRQAAKNLGCLEEEGGVSFAGGYFLVGLRGRVWRVQPNFDSFEIADGFVAIGSGEPFALAAMKALATTTTDLRTIVEGALIIAEHYCPTVRGPFTVVSGNGTAPRVRQRSRANPRRAGTRPPAKKRTNAPAAGSNKGVGTKAGPKAAVNPSRPGQHHRPVAVHRLSRLTGPQQHDVNDPGLGS